MSVSIGELEGPEAPVVLARLRGAAPVSWVDAIGGWLVTGYRPAVEVMRDARSFTVDDARFSTAQVVGASMLSLDGAEHRRHRLPFVAPFLPGRVEADLGDRVEALAVGLVEGIRSRGRADLRAAVAAPLAAAVVGHVLGLRSVDTTTMLGWYRDIAGAVSTITAGGRSAPSAAAAVQDLAGHLRRSLADGCPLLTAAAGLSEAEVVSNAAVVMFGGIETTEAAIANVIMHVLHDERVRVAVTAEPSRAAAAVEESLRIEPAAAVVDRYATDDVRIDGTRIGRGALVRVSITGANRDPAVFPDPDRFEMGRPNVRAQLSFARGPHACVAMDLARLEATVALRTVLQRLPEIHLDGPASARGLVFRKPAAVTTVWRHGRPVGGRT